MLSPVGFLFLATSVLFLATGVQSSAIGIFCCDRLIFNHPQFTTSF